MVSSLSSYSRSENKISRLGKFASGDYWSPNRGSYKI